MTRVVPLGGRAPATGYFLWQVPFTKTEWQRYLAVCAQRRSGFGHLVSSVEHKLYNRIRDRLISLDFDTEALPINVQFLPEGTMTRRTSARRSSRRLSANAASATVETFLTVFSSILTQYDQMLSKKESARGRVNIYRLGHYMNAIGKIRDNMQPYLHSSSEDAIFKLRIEIEDAFTSGNPGDKLRKVVDAYLTSGTLPKVPLRKNGDKTIHVKHRTASITVDLTFEPDSGPRPAIDIEVRDGGRILTTGMFGASGLELSDESILSEKLREKLEEELEDIYNEWVLSLEDEEDD